MKELNGRVAVITGAGSGFGREFARIGARSGMRLVLADVQADALAAIVDELRQTTQVIGEVVDVADTDDVQRLADRAFAEYGNVHLLMNNAGVGGGGYLWESTANDWQWVMGVNLMGVVHGVRHFVPRMLAANARGEPGHVVNTASMAGWLCPPLMGVYNVSKHAVVALTETLFHDLRLADSTIGVSLLCPAFVPTGISNSHRNRPPSLRDGVEATSSQQQAQAAVAKAVTHGKITAEQVAELTFDAIRDDRFYVFTHPRIMPGVEARFAAVLVGTEPADPYATRPDAKPAHA
jgi:NAD(P)-dependent dehydrogenase (short-subunit alcohol dehydrogenase family)